MGGVVYVDQVIDVACAAKRALDQSAEADRRCVELNELAQRASEQAASVRELATSLTQTASSVARLALDVCRYHSYQQAFEATFGVTHRAPPIDVDTFLSLVENSKHTATGTAETAAQRGAASCLGTCSEVDEMMMSYEGTQSHHEMSSDDHVCDASTSNDEVAQLTTDQSYRVECPSSFFHSVSVPAMYVNVTNNC